MAFVNLKNVIIIFMKFVKYYSISVDIDADRLQIRSNILRSTACSETFIVYR